MDKHCKDCQKIKSVKEFHFSNKAKGKLQIYCKPCFLTRKNKWRKTDKGQESLKRYWTMYNNSEVGKIVQKKYRQSDKGRKVHNAYKVKRRAAIKRATPPWADVKAIEGFYANAPKGKEVDHIYPLLGKNVSGLHVLKNLQYLTPLENSIKGNRI